MSRCFFVSLALVLSLATVTGQQKTIDLYGSEPRAAHAVRGVQANTVWVWAGTALTASTVRQWFQFGFPAVQYVRWLLVWNAEGNAANGARLIHADDGPTNITTIAEFTGLTSTNPIVSGVDITTAWNGLILGSVTKNIGIQLRGNPTIFRASIEIVE